MTRPGVASAATVGVGVLTGSGRDGTGEAVLVAVRAVPTALAAAAGAMDGVGRVEVVWRGGVTLVEGGSGQVLHRVQGLPSGAAAAVADEAAAVARRLAGEALAGLLAELTAAPTERGPGVVVAVPVGADVDELDGGLDAVMASHRLIHVAEVALFRDALAAAAEDAGLAVVRLPDADVAAETSARAAELAALGRLAGRPWRKAERQAATAALLALSGAAQLDAYPQVGT